METEAVIKNLQQQVNGLHEVLIMAGSAGSTPEDVAGYFTAKWQDRVNRRLDTLEKQVKSLMLKYQPVS